MLRLPSQPMLWCGLTSVLQQRLLHHFIPNYLTRSWPSGVINQVLCFCLFVLTLPSCAPATGNESEVASEKPKGKYSTGEMTIQHGMQLFNLHCASCHNFSENGIGPNLSGVTAEVDKDWLVSFIKNPPALIESGDVRAKALFEKYKQYMPPFPMLEDQDLDDILGFIHKFSLGEKRNSNNRPGGLLNPIAERIPSSGLSLQLEDHFIVPPSSEVTPVSRINKMVPIPGGRLFIHDLRGKLYEVKEDKTLNVYLDLLEILPQFIDNPGKGSGFASWAFHPDFEQNGLFYTTHSEPAKSAIADHVLPDSIKVTLQFVLLEWQTKDPKSDQFSGTHRELLRADMASGAHTFQEVTFNPLAQPGTPDYGMLYLGIGDSGMALQRHPSLCDNNEHIWGSVIRINPTGRNSSNGQYGIPEDNPFVRKPNALPEIWAYGFRNPHRISWDETGSGKMLITNIGQHSVEEVNLGKAGANYGWPYREGTLLFDIHANPELVYPIPTDEIEKQYMDPAIQYDHDEGSAVSGGFVYAGEEVEALKGKYIFGDISLGTLFYSNIDEVVQGSQAPIYRLDVSYEGKLTDLSTVTGCKRVELRLGIDQHGELYVMTKCNGAVYKVAGCEKVDI